MSMNLHIGGLHIGGLHIGGFILGVSYREASYWGLRRSFDDFLRIQGVSDVERMELKSACMLP